MQRADRHKDLTSTEYRKLSKHLAKRLQEPVVHPLRDNLIAELAKFLTENEARKSIELQMGVNADVKAWANLRTYAGVRGWGVSQRDAIACIRHVLGIKE